MAAKIPKKGVKKVETIKIKRQNRSPEAESKSNIPAIVSNNIGNTMPPRPIRNSTKNTCRAEGRGFFSCASKVSISTCPAAQEGSVSDSLIKKSVLTPKSSLMAAK